MKNEKKVSNYYMTGVDEKLLRRVKMLAAYRGISTKELIVSLLEAEVENNADIV